MNWRRGAGIALLSFAPAIAAAQPALIQNGRVESLPTASIDAAIAGTPADSTAAWIAWRVPMNDGAGSLCSTWSDQEGYVRGTRLEADGRPRVAAPDGPVRLDSGTGLVVMIRVRHKGLDRLQRVSDDCAVDAAGATVRWLDNVTPAESVRYLEAVAYAPPQTRLVPDAHLATAAVGIIGLHRHDAATTVLERFLEQARDVRVRAEAAYWYARRAGPRELGRVRALLAADTDDQVERRTLMGLSMLPPDTAVPLLIDLARSAPALAVRKQAVRALGRSRDPRAVTFVEELVEK